MSLRQAILWNSGGDATSGDAVENDDGDVVSSDDVGNQSSEE